MQPDRVLWNAWLNVSHTKLESSYIGLRSEDWHEVKGVYCHAPDPKEVTTEIYRQTRECITLTVIILNATTSALACILLVAVLSFGQVAWAQTPTLHTCLTSTPPTLDGTMQPGEWTSACTFNLQLKGVDTDLSDNTGTNDPTPPPPDKPMTLIVLRDSENIYLGFQWNHDTKGADATQYLLGLGFDFNANGLWEDGDYAQLGKDSVHTIDDALLLVYLGHYVGNPVYDPNAWISLYLPHGLYVLSWGPNNDNPPTFQFGAISGPQNDAPNSHYTQPDDLGARDRNNNPVSFPYGAAEPPESMLLGYRYTMEIAVPLVLFHSPAGFGFALTQLTGVETGEIPSCHGLGQPWRGRCPILANRRAPRLWASLWETWRTHGSVGSLIQASKAHPSVESWRLSTSLH